MNPSEHIEPTGEFLLYETEDGRTRVECRFIDETLWLTQSGMAELYQTTKQNVAKHLKAIFADGELAQNAVVNQWLTTATDGKRYQVGFYNLDAILAVGYRVRSTRGTQFRRWATERLREYLVKGFTMDDDRLKNPPVAGSGVPDHFDELLELLKSMGSDSNAASLGSTHLAFHNNLLSITLFPASSNGIPNGFPYGQLACAARDTGLPCFV